MFLDCSDMLIFKIFFLKKYIIILIYFKIKNNNNPGIECMHHTNNIVVNE
jgi:hypothetical protein